MTDLTKLLSFTDKQITSGGCVNIDLIDKGLSRVYFLLKNNVVVYVGQTINLSSRENSHKSNKDFDAVSFLCVDPSIANDIEANYIVRFKPIGNISLPGNSFFIRKSMAKKKLANKIKDLFLNYNETLFDNIDVVYTDKCGCGYNQIKSNYIPIKDYDFLMKEIIKNIQLNINLNFLSENS